jgi:hypothetical protein
MSPEELQERIDLFAEWKQMSLDQRGELYEWWLETRTDFQGQWPFVAFAMSTSTIVKALKERREQQ